LQDLVSLLSGRNFETRQYEEDMAAASLEDILMPTIQIELPDEMLLSLKETPEGLSKMIRMAAAAKLYELGKLSSGRAADLAGLPRVSFLQALGQYGVSIFTLTKEEFAQDLRNA
jgi:predicted HTH domain antitoxin